MTPFTAHAPAELHLLLILSDSALPTGGFIASSGLESFAKHGFLHTLPFPSSSSSSSSSAITITAFAQAEVQHYAHTTSPFVISSHKCVSSALDPRREKRTAKGKEEAIDDLVRFDGYHESTLLSHVARRSSRAQGIALLTLFSRGLTAPPGFSPDEDQEEKEQVLERGERAREIVEGYKRLIRLGRGMGHLAICWGVVCAALGLSLDRSLHLYIFLHARSLLSSAVRLNLIGPYASSQLLLHPFRAIIDDAVSASQTSLPHPLQPHTAKGDEADFWAWADEADSGPATTWPLGELLMARHDLQHSRIFNS